MAFDVSGLSMRELSSLLKKAEDRKALLEKRFPVGKVRAAIVKFAKDHGYTIEEIFGGPAAGQPVGRKAAGAKRKRKVPPKYRNPDNPRETWSGRGNQPRWLAAQTGKGKPLSKFLIKP